MRHQAIASWKQQAGGEFGIIDWGCLAGDVDGIAHITIQTNILMLQADVIL